MKNPAEYAKAIWAGGLGFATAFLSALLPFLTEGGFEQVTALGWVTAVLAGLGSLALVGGTVYGVANKEPVPPIY